MNRTTQVHRNTVQYRACSNGCIVLAGGYWQGSIQWGRRGRSFYPASTPNFLVACCSYSTGKQTLIHQYAAYKISTIPVVNIGNNNQDPSYCHTIFSQTPTLYKHFYPNQKILDRTLTGVVMNMQCGVVMSVQSSSRESSGWYL